MRRSLPDKIKKIRERLNEFKFRNIFNEDETGLDFNCFKKHTSVNMGTKK